MLKGIVDFSLSNRALVLIAAVLLVLGGGYALTQLPLDAVPDITNVQVQVLTKAPALAPVEMEQFVTYPIEAAMNGLPRLVEIRSISRYGLSAVTAVCEDGVNVYFARQLVSERLAQARDAIPPEIGSPEMGPVTTGLGDVFQFTVEGESVSAMERRTILDWQIAPRLRAVPGVTEVNTWGGLPKQYQVVVEPSKLLAYNPSSPGRRADGVDSRRVQRYPRDGQGDSNRIQTVGASSRGVARRLRGGVAIADGARCHGPECRNRRTPRRFHHGGNVMQKRLEKLEAMYRLNQSILTLLDINVLLKQVLEIMHDTFGCDNSAVLLFDPKSEELYIAAAAGYKQDMVRRFRTSVGGHGVTGFVARNREPLFVPDTSADPRYVPGVEGARSEIAIPLLVNDQLYGVLDVESQKEYSFTEDDFKVLCVFASHIAMALHNALIFESERKRFSQLEVLNQIRNRLSARQEVNKLLQTVASSIVEFFNFHHVLIFLHDDQEQKLRVIASAALDPAAPAHSCELCADDNIVARTFSERRALIVPARDGSPFASQVVAEADSEMCIPIAAGGMPIGAIYVGNVGSAGFDRKDLQVLEAISEQLSTVVTDAFAFQRESKRDRHIEVIHRIGLVPLQSFDFRKFTDDIVSLIYDVYRFYHVSLYSYEKRSQQLELVAFAGEEMRDQQVGDKIGPGEGIVGHVARTGDYFLCNDTTAESRYNEAFLDTKSELTLPIRCDQEIVGVLNLESRKLNQFDKSDIDVFGKIADQVGYTIKNAELFRQKSSAHNLLLNLNSLSREINATFDRKKILSAVVKQLPDLIGCRLCSVFFYHSQENTLELMVHNLPYLDEGDGMTVSVDDNVLMKKVISLNRSVYVADIETELSIPNKPQYATKSFLNILLRHQERIIGVLNLTDKADRHVFSSEEFYLAHSFCEHLATAIVNAERYQKILELSITDGLTGLYVHRYFQEALDREIARSSRYKLPLSLLFLDLDNFKRFNDTYGHQVGDIVLREVAIALRTVTRAVDIACRYGGEEFTVILPSTSLEQARVIAERLRRKVASHAVVYGRKELAVTASIGICQYRPGLSKADLIELADKAMQRAKASGKNLAVASEARSAGTSAQ